MKIKEIELDSSVIGDFKEVTSKIANKDLGIALNMVSKNLYSNPIGSFIRELTSNAVDANVDANIDEPVRVTIYKEEESYFIEFSDDGVGMSVETYDNIYMSWFNSDKRDTDTKIGGWGLGSKSPLSYQDSFEIITRFNGLEYHRLFINEAPLPKSILLTANETDLPNGTTIKVEIKNENDAYIVHSECIKQLAYFNTVYVKNTINYYDNNFKLYDTTHFKIREKPPYNNMHICLGQVTYPINWSTIDIDPIQLPVALKFDIGELEVTLSREEINYTEEVIEKISNKVKLVEALLIEKYEKQLIVKDLEEYLNVVSNRTRPLLKIETINIAIPDTYKIIPIFEPFKGLKIVKKYIDALFCQYTVTSFTNASKGLKDRLSVNHFLYNSSDYFLVKERLNTYDSRYISDNYNSRYIYLIKKEKLNRKHLIKIATLLNLIDQNGEIIPGKLGEISRVIKYVNHFINNKLKIYDDIAKDYVEEYKEQDKQDREDRKSNVTAYDPYYGSRKTYNFSQLKDNYTTVFYLSKEEPNDVKNNYDKLHEIVKNYLKRKTILLVLSESTIKKYKNKLKLKDIKDIFKYKILQNKLYSCKIANTINLQFRSNLFHYSDYYNNLYQKLYSKYYSSDNIWIATYFCEEIESIKPTKNRTELLYEDYIPILKEVQQKLDILNYITYGVPLEYIQRIVKLTKMTKLNLKYYKSNLLIINPETNDNKEENSEESNEEN